MIDWLAILEEIKKQKRAGISTAKPAKVRTAAKVGRYSDTKSKVIYLPTAQRAKALRLFDELAMNPPVKLSEWACVCVANSLVVNEATFMATLARDLVSMNRVVIKSGIVFDAEKYAASEQKKND